MDYLIVFFILTVNILVARFLGNSNGFLLSAGINYIVGFVVYFYLVAVEKGFISKTEEVNRSKHILVISVSILLFSLGVSLVNSIMNINIFVSEFGWTYWGQIARMLIIDSTRLMVTNSLLIGINVLIFMIIKKSIFGVALSIKKSKF